MIEREPTKTIAPFDKELLAEALAAAEPASLPISKAGAVTTCRWMIENFGEKLDAAAEGKKYKVAHLCAVICQETAYKWLKWIDKHSPETILQRCVFDASGDYPGTSRSAFPKNTAEFRARYKNDLTEMLIKEANESRRLQGWDDKPWVYKGYGIFQYDLQKIDEDEAFFREKRWYSIDECIDRCCKELDEKLKNAKGDLWKAIKAYNGSGPKAEQYAANVKVFAEYCAAEIG